MTATFSDLGVPAPICEALTRRGIDAPFEIQAATIADALAGKDVLGRAPTGSGKTLAFGIPLVANVGRASKRSPLALVLAPTRELAEQINSELRTFAGNKRIAAVYGGVGYGPQRKALNQGVEILVACPGRLEDLIEQGDVDLSQVSQVVLDEADRMADMGFMPAVRRLLDQTARKRQTVLFSATLDGDVAKLTRDHQKNPVRHEVGEATPDITLADHVFWKTERADRVEVTAKAVDAVWPAIIFCRTRHGSDRLAKQLAKHGIKTAAIHGGRSQGQRTRALEEFSKSRVHALVATDVAARGIHVDGVASVIHYDPPEDHKTYVHRSGRTARAGESGVVVSLLLSDQIRDANKMQKKLDLNEPVTTPNAVALREMSDAPARTLAESRPDRPERSGRSDRNRSGGGRGRPSNRGGRQQSKARAGGGSRRPAGGGGSEPRRRRGDSEGDASDGRDRRDDSPRQTPAGSGSGGGSARRNSKPGRRSDGAKSSSRSGGGPKSDSRSGKSKSAGGTKSRTGKKARHAAGDGPKGPNRKARRAHLQKKD